MCSPSHKTEGKRFFRQRQIAHGYLVVFFRGNDREVFQGIGNQCEGDKMHHFETNAHPAPVSERHKVFGLENFAVANEPRRLEIARLGPQFLGHVQIVIVQKYEVIFVDFVA